MVLFYLIFYICGVATNGYLLVRFCKSWSSPISKNFNDIALFQLFLNACNIVTHAGLELSNKHPWRVISTIFSFLSIYFLAALMLSIAAGRSLRQRLNSSLNIAIFALILMGLFTLFGRKHELCASDNCFSLNLATTDDDSILWYSAIVHFYLPTVFIVSGSWYYGMRRYFEQTSETLQSNFLTNIARLGSNCAVSIFIVYGLFVVNGILYFNESREIARTDSICRIICLNEDLYLLLSIFPVYMGHFMKKHELKPRQELEA